MTATERLRELLDERGVEHFDGCENTLWGYEQTSESTGIYRYSADEISGGFVNVWLHHCTPEQAVAATLGSRNCSNNCTNSERTGAPRLPHFWTHDGVLHIEATRMPTRIVVCEGGTCEFVPKRELDASEAENAKLRQENQSVGMAAYELGRARLADENAKLRKLAHKMWKPFCWAQSGCEVCLTDVQDAEIRDLALELGVEVDW